MPEELGPERVRQIILLWLIGLSMAQIAKVLDLGGKGTVSKKVKEERELNPGLDDLKRFITLLIEKKVKDPEAMKAVNLLAQMEENHLEDCLELTRRYKDKVLEAIDMLTEVKALETKEGKPYGQIRLDVAELKGTLEELQEAKRQLDTAIKRLEARLGDLQEYDKLKRNCDDLALGPQQLNGFATFHRQLIQLDFTQEYALQLATALKTKDLLPKDAAEVLTKALVKYESLDRAVSDLEAQKERLEIEIRPKIVEKDTVEGHVKALQGHINELVKTETSLGETVKNLERAMTTLEEAPASLKTIVDGAVKDIGTAPIKEMKNALDEMKEKVKAATADFSAAATEIQTKAANAKADIEDAMQKSLDLGKTVGQLNQTNKIFRFIYEGEGLPDEVASYAVDFLEMLDYWQYKHIPDSDRLKRIEFDGVIKEIKRKWARLGSGN